MPSLQIVMMSGGNVFDLQKLLGHTKIELTMVYAHLSPKAFTRIVAIHGWRL